MGAQWRHLAITIEPSLCCGDTALCQITLITFLVFTAHAMHCKRCTSYSNSVCLCVTRRYCVKTTARSTVQFAPLDSKMCLVLWKPKNIPQGRPLPPEILAQSDLPTPEVCEF